MKIHVYFAIFNFNSPEDSFEDLKVGIEWGEPLYTIDLSVILTHKKL